MTVSLEEVINQNRPRFVIIYSYSAALALEPCALSPPPQTESAPLKDGGEDDDDSKFARHVEAGQYR